MNLPTTNVKLFASYVGKRITLGTHIGHKDICQYVLITLTFIYHDLLWTFGVKLY